jgi:hypothetical protein
MSQYFLTTFQIKEERRSYKDDEQGQERSSGILPKNALQLLREKCVKIHYSCVIHIKAMYNIEDSI